MNTVVTIVLSMFASTGLFTLVQFLINRHDNKKNIKKRLDKIEKDSVRLQLLFLIKLMPTETQEIMECAQHYFKDLDANWYASPIFYKWMREYKVARPEWFKGEI